MIRFPLRWCLLFLLLQGASGTERWGGGLGTVTVVRSGKAETGRSVALRWQSSLDPGESKVFDHRIDDLGSLILVVSRVENWNPTKVSVMTIPWGGEIDVAMSASGVSLKFDGNENRQFQLRWEEAVGLGEAIRSEHEAIRKETTPARSGRE